MTTAAIRRAAEAEGYELAHSQDDGSSSRSFGLLIFVKMSDRKIGDFRDHNEIDGRALYKAADEIKLALETTSAQLDPEGPAQREYYRAQIANIYEGAGVPAIYMEPLPNGYCSSPCCLNRPWFRVTSKIGHVVIGWRKSVMEIDWKDTVVKAHGETLFPEEKVTRFETGIHAYGAEKASEYIQRLHDKP